MSGYVNSGSLHSKGFCRSQRHCHPAGDYIQVSVLNVLDLAITIILSIFIYHNDSSIHCFGKSKV